MSPTGIAAGQLRQLIYYNLDHDMLDNANFLAGRLLALEPRNRDNHHLIALTYLRARRYKAAHDFAQKHGHNGSHLGCAYVYAQACKQLGLFGEGIDALRKCDNVWKGKSDWKAHSETTRRHIPDAPAAWTLLGKLYNARGDARSASECWLEAHRSNPLVWDAFEGLCSLQADLKVANMFKPTMMMPDMVADQKSSDDAQIYVDEDTRLPLVPQPNFGSRTLRAPSEDPFTTRTDSGLDVQERVKPRGALNTALRPPMADLDTPVLTHGTLDHDVTMTENVDDTFHEPPAAPSRRQRVGPQLEASDRPKPPMLRDTSQVHEDAQQAAKRAVGGPQKRTISGAQPANDASQPRRSGRLGTQMTTARTTRSAMGDASTMSAVGRADRAARTAKPATGAKGRNGVSERGAGRVVSGNRKILPPADDKEKEKRTTSRASERATGPGVTSATALSQKDSQVQTGPSQEQIRAEQDAMTGLLDTFRQLAIASYAICPKYKSAEAIATLSSLPTTQRETPYVLAQLAKAHYEAASYDEAEEFYSRLVKIQPSRIEDMEIYSTVLWHLKKEVPLAFLARTLHDTAYESPQTWVAMGNSYSLAREHDMAISAFKRATQLDDTFTYAYTLLGHEFMANEDFAAALESFRQAVKLDPRGYGGWYGIGKCYERMSGGTGSGGRQLELAESHYRQASMLNPGNATLHVCIGVVMERMRNKEAALSCYERALELQPEMPLGRFKKARVLMHLRDFESALEELEALANGHGGASDEANVHFLLGKCYKSLGRRSEALNAFSVAGGLDAKAAQYIKEEVEKMNVGDEEDSDEED